MDEAAIVLTNTDKAILESYMQLCEGLSDYLGDGYELVLHSLENYDHSVVKIINGYHTGRTEGAPITDFALTLLTQIRSRQDAGYITYTSQNKKGEPLKSTTITIQGEGGRIIGLLCINFYMNTPFTQVIGSYFPQRESAARNHRERESFVDNVDELIYTAVHEVRSQVMDDPAISSINKNKEIIAQLLARGIFNLKDSVLKTAQILAIGKNTVYMHIRNLSS